MREERVPVGQVRIGVERYRGDLEFTLHRSLIQGFDVRQLVHIASITGVDSLFRQRPEHEGVVRIRAVRNVKRGHG